ncbi:hypothetical protein B484DRAFT_73869 [Ochromonadaceae sp. CCMP2298]|nr:hypothetical protein B484DRAFT_73869 [Ochromonadaceae sp. CCMP2298]
MEAKAERQGLRSNIISPASFQAYVGKGFSGNSIKYGDVTNFSRRNSEFDPVNCVMCGERDVVIPSQNKDVCKKCDTAFWSNDKLGLVFKFCKGCKNFVCLGLFFDKPEASKCCKCRKRGRENYLTKKGQGAGPTAAQTAAQSQTLAQVQGQV